MSFAVATPKYLLFEQFVKDAVVFTGHRDHEVSTADLYEIYSLYCKLRGLKAYSRRNFSYTFGTLKAGRRKCKFGLCFTGITLRVHAVDLLHEGGSAEIRRKLREIGDVR